MVTGCDRFKEKMEVCMTEDKNLVIVDNREIQNMIYIFRGKQVMIDSDLAMLYQVETKYLNRQRGRNADRFLDDFCFQLTKEEYKFLRCQNVTSKKRQWFRWQKIHALCFYRTRYCHAFRCA